MDTVAGHLARVDTFLLIARDDIAADRPEEVPALLDRAQLRTRSALKSAENSVVIGLNPRAHQHLLAALNNLLAHLEDVIKADQLEVTSRAMPGLMNRVNALFSDVGECKIIPLPPRAEDDRPVFDAESIYVAAAPPHAPKVGDIWVDTTKDISVCTFDGTWVSATSR